MENFTPVASGLGGLMIGAAAAIILLVHGRIAGISGILGGLLMPTADRFRFQAAFTAGLLVAGTVGVLVLPGAFEFSIGRSTPALIAAGLLVGYGTQLGRGCTSGHGVCGIGRFSRRSVVATCTFMAAGAATVVVITQLFGGTI